MYSHRLIKTEPSKQRILIVDDEPVNLRILGQHLSQSYEVILATSGTEALACASKHLPDLILLDIIMEDIDGFEVCRQLRLDPKTQNIPIIFSTAMNSVEAEVKGLNMGASDYITKPFNMALVLARVRIQLQLKKKTDLLEKLVSLDGLTEIPNRRYFEEKFEEEWRRAQRFINPLTLCMMDIDFFKSFNDNYGHGAGDICLQKVALCLASNVKRSGDMLARYGGEEFVLLLPNTTVDQGEVVAERLRLAVEALCIEHQFSDNSDKVTISVGVASIHRNFIHGKRSLLDAADDELYQSKRNGRNQISGRRVDAVK